MKAIEYARHGLPHEVCQCVDVDDAPAPRPGEITAAVLASAINPADLLIIEGRYPGPTELPARQGIEAAGKVVAVGDGVDDLAVGDPVVLLPRGNWAERVIVPAEQAIKVPAELDLLSAAQIKANPPSAHFMLQDYKDLQEGDWVIQNAATSAVGRHVIHLAARMGVRTVNVVRSDASIELLKAIGADLVLVDGDDLGARVRAEIGDASLPLALDAIGGESCQNLADCLSDGGTVVNYGFLSGDPCMITPSQAIFHQITLEGFWLVKRLFQSARQDIVDTYEFIARLFIDEIIDAPVEATYTLDQISVALEHAGRGGRQGKIVLTPNGPLD